jgi:uncharacterized protein (DUF1501 family)
MALLPPKFTQAIKAIDKQKSNNKRALVIVYLGGGSDNFNFISPTTGTNRVNYEAARSEENRIPVDTTGNTQLMPGWQMHPQCFKPVLTGGSYAYHSPTTTVVTSTAVSRLTPDVRLNTGDQVYIDFKTVHTGTTATSGVFTATVLTSSTFIIDRSVDVDQTGSADITIRKNTFMHLIDQGKAAVIMNVGPLMEPTSRANVGGAYYGQPASVKLPVQIASHSDQNALWQTGVAQNPQYATGWAGRAMDLLNPVYNSTLTNGEPTVLYPSSLSFSGVGVAFRANDQHAAGMSPGGLNGRLGKILTNAASTSTRNEFGSGTQGQLLTNFNNVLYTDTTSSNALIKEYLAAQQRSDVATQVISAVLDATNTFNTFTTIIGQKNPSTGKIETNNPVTGGNELIYSSLTSTARLIKGMFDTTPSRDLQQNRQIFFMTLGGFDQHDDLIDDQNKRLAPLMNSLRQFYDATVELGIQDHVTLLV